MKKLRAVEILYCYGKTGIELLDHAYHIYSNTIDSHVFGTMHTMCRAEKTYTTK